MPATLQLPFGFRGLTVPRLLLARLLRAPVAEQAFYVAEGLRHDFHASDTWTVGVPLPTPRPLARFFGGMRNMLVDYDQAIAEGHPLVEFAAAGVFAATRRGTRVLVIVPPIPVHMLRPRGLYDPGVVAGRIDVLRTAVESNGGHLLDLHDALGPTQFRDASGHFNDDGVERMIELVWPHVRTLLALGAA